MKRKPQLGKDEADEFVAAIIFDLICDGETERAKQIKKDWKRFLGNFS